MSSTSSVSLTNNQTAILDNVIVVEKEFKSKSIHSGNINCICKISGKEFMTSSDDQSFKIWDNDLQGVSYTYETHEPIYNMARTGEKNNILIAALGQGNLIVMGLDQRNQNDIIQGAHEEKIVQIITLRKLQNKYFATRCEDGDVSIWSATPHPDKIFTILNVDQEENASNVQDTFRESSRDDLQNVTHAAINKELEELQEEENEDVDNDGSPLKKVKQEVPQIPIKKEKLNRISSEHDKMIDTETWQHQVIQSSATVLCFSNYKESFVNIAIIDLKTRRKNIVKQFKMQNKPTYLYLSNDNNLFVGTTQGKIEQWVIDEGVCKHLYDAHPESEEGISQLKLVETQSTLLRGNEFHNEPEFNLIASTSFGTTYFRIWKLYVKEQLL
mmetsp:Transcript_17518/g.29525  ORF Transcript_17518/g.29525 Transcript_17518/m.29525 type:complete len:386 (+) Transcript_17518:37-1194(+)